MHFKHVNDCSVCVCSVCVCILRMCTPEISVFSPNTRKYRPEITPYLDTFTQRFDIK